MYLFALHLFPLLIFLIHSNGELFCITQKVLAALKCYGFL